jgi:D-alanine-D-alanine ligase
MRIGISYDIKCAHQADETGLLDGPDDCQEEFDSPATIEAIASVFRNLGHQVTKLGDGRELLEQLLADPPDFVFNVAEGTGIGRCRESRVPAVLEMLGIPYSGSDPLTLGAALDKQIARQWTTAAGVSVPWGKVIYPENDLGKADFSSWPWPVIIKPAWEGSSKGIRGRSLVDEPKQAMSVLSRMRRDYRQPLLVEEYIEGDEFTVGILGNDQPVILGVMKISPRCPTARFIYSLEVKRDFQRRVVYELSPACSSDTTAAIEHAALQVYHTLGCRDVARIDFRVRAGTPFFLEANPLPGLNPETSDLVIMARLVGWSYSRLIETIWNAAVARHHHGNIHARRESGGKTLAAAT